jgi:hypothetical protein
VPLQGGVVTSPPLTGLAVGVHEVQAVFGDPAGNFEGSRRTLRQLVVPAAPMPPATPTKCSAKLQLTEVVKVGTTSVRISGLAPLAKAGADVRIEAGNRRVGSAEVRDDGTFTTRVAGDAGERSELAYRAKLGDERSLAVSLDRPLTSLGRGISGPDQARFRLRIEGGPGRRLELSRQTGCGKAWSKLREVRSGRAGEVILRLPRPALGEGPAIYRLRVKSKGDNGPASLPIVVRERTGP